MPDKKRETKDLKEFSVEAEEVRNYCYIGPNLPEGALKKNTLIVGTKTQIKEKFKEEIEKYPQLEKLIVEVEHLAIAKAKVSVEGNTLNKSYADVAANAEAARG